MVTRTLPVLTEADLQAGGGTAGSNGSFATAGSSFTYDATTMPWYMMEIVDTGSDTTTLSSDTNPDNTDGGPNVDNEGSDGETGTLFDPSGNPIGTPGGRVAADRWGVMEGSDGSIIEIYEIENFDDIDIYVFSAPLVDGVTYTTTVQNTRDAGLQYSQVMCLAAGTQITTPAGPRPIEGLQVGDIVLTADTGPQPVLGISVQDLCAAHLVHHPQKPPHPHSCRRIGKSR